jgi:GH24 family phage-related lysozyme (muramidase)
MAEFDHTKWGVWIGHGASIAAALLLATYGSAAALSAIGVKVPQLPGMKTSSDGKVKEALALAIPKVKASEGFRATPYNDGVGVKTIGYGETKPEIVAKGSITEEEASKLMVERLERDFLKPSLSLLREDTKNKLTVGQVAAIASFAYNTGVEGFKKSKFGAHLISGDIAAAEKVLPHSYVNPGTGVEHGLRNRRQAELALFTMK